MCSQNPQTTLEPEHAKPRRINAQRRADGVARSVSLVCSAYPTLTFSFPAEALDICQRHSTGSVAGQKSSPSELDVKVVGAGLYRGNFGRHGDNGAAAMAACERRS